MNVFPTGLTLGCPAVSPCFHLGRHAGRIHRTRHEGIVQGPEHELGEGARGHQHQFHHVRLSQTTIWYLLTADYARVLLLSIVYTNGER